MIRAREVSDLERLRVNEIQSRCHVTVAKVKKDPAITRHGSVRALRTTETPRHQP